MLQSRRGFLIGVGAMLTTAFVKDARSFIHRNSQPLLTSPPQVVETMYWYEIPDEGYQLTLGPWSFAPPPPTWRKFFISEGIPHRTESEIERICSSHLIEPGDFDKPISDWEDWLHQVPRYRRFGVPSADIQRPTERSGPCACSYTPN
jgi:hypothetical protein